MHIHLVDISPKRLQYNLLGTYKLVCLFLSYHVLDCRQHSLHMDLVNKGQLEYWNLLLFDAVYGVRELLMNMLLE